MTTSAIRLEVPEILRGLCLWSVVFVVCTTLTATWLYLPSHPGFSPANTYLSEIGGAGGWPAAVFNSGLLIVAPLRFLIAVVLALRFREFGVSKGAANTVVILAFITAFGTALMTAAPYNAGPVAHKLGILLYFFGTVIVQSVITVIEVRCPSIPRLLPMLSASMVLVYTAFAGSLALWAAGTVSRMFPVPLEWACFVMSILWVVGHGVVLGGRTRRE